MAVETGFQGSAKVVVAAAVIMIGVFMAFVHTDNVYVKPIALGLTVGIAADAFLVRMTLIPALMAALGEKAWWLPTWLDRLLPVVDVEGEGLEQALEQEEAAAGQSARPVTDSSGDEAEDTEGAADPEDRSPQAQDVPVRIGPVRRVRRPLLHPVAGPCFAAPLRWSSGPGLLCVAVPHGLRRPTDPRPRRPGSPWRR